MKIKFFSKTKIGKAAAVFTLLFIILISLKLSVLGISIRVPLPIPFIAGLGLIGFTIVITSFIKNKDRAVFTILSIIIGSIISFWIVAEIFL